MGFDDIAVSGDIGRINPEENILPEQIQCPKMKWGGKLIQRKTLSLSQCISRIQEKNPCIKDCRVASTIQLALRQGYEYV